jgi:pilus assembly protein CpaC
VTLNLHPAPLVRRPVPGNPARWRTVICALLAAMSLSVGLLETTAAAAPGSDSALAGTPKRGREAVARRARAQAATAAAAASAQPDPTSAVQTPVNEQTVRVDLGGGGASRSLTLPRGKSAVIELPVDARDVVVSNPKVAEVILSTPRRVYLLGQTAGQTDAVFFDGSGRQLLRLEVRVDQDVSGIAQTLGRMLPGSQLHVEAVNDSVILSGQVPDAASADKAVRVAGGFVSKPENVINMLSIAGPEQVMLKVRIVEVNRSIIKQLGFNLSTLVGQTGMNQYLAGISPTYGVNGALMGGLTGGYKIDTTSQPELTTLCPTGTCPQVVHGPTSGFTNWNTAGPAVTAGSTGVNQAKAMIQAFERVGLVRTLAEPNVTAISGESAKFLAGGEFPVPVSQDSSGRITVEFKQYGVGLGFSPVVLGPGRISLKVSTEVSEISSLNAFSASGSSSGSALVIPGLNVRRVETTVELPSGGALMLAGLLQNTTKQTLDALPGLMELPVIGPLFRSRDFLNNQSELVVIITPYLVKGTSPDQLSTPADGLVIANDFETDLLGHLNSGFTKPAAGTTYQGPFGYVVE